MGCWRADSVFSVISVYQDPVPVPGIFGFGSRYFSVQFQFWLFHAQGDLRASEIVGVRNEFLHQQFHICFLIVSMRGTQW